MRLIAAMSLVLSLLAASTAPSFADGTTPTPSPSPDPTPVQTEPIVCKDATATVTEGDTLVIKNVLKNCTSSTGEKMVLGAADCETGKGIKPCYASTSHTASDIKVHMEAIQQGKEQDFTIGYQVSDKRRYVVVEGHILVHVRHYRYLKVTRIDKSHIRVHNPNGKVIDPKPLKFTVNWWSHAHGAHFGGKVYSLKPGKTQVFTLEPRVRSQKDISWSASSASRVNVDSHNMWLLYNNKGRWVRISRT